MRASVKEHHSLRNFWQPLESLGSLGFSLGFGIKCPKTVQYDDPKPLHITAGQGQGQGQLLVAARHSSSLVPSRLCDDHRSPGAEAPHRETFVPRLSAARRKHRRGKTVVVVLVNIP